MKQIQYILTILLLTSLVRADILISEVMYDPSQCPDTSCEWLELYNSGNSPVDLTEYKINNAAFDDIILPSKKHIVIARKLTGLQDEESFENYWGNRDGIWNEQDGFLAVDGTLSLTNTAGIINLTGPSEFDTISYTSSIGGNGNGKTLIRQNLTKTSLLIEGILDGTPGRSETTSDTNGSQPLLSTSIEVLNIAPEISSLEFPDESSEEGYQLFPETNKNISISLSGFDKNGVIDELKAFATIKKDNVLIQNFNLTKKQQNSSTTYFQQDIILNVVEDGIYTVEFTLEDSSGSKTIRSIEFEYLGLISISFDKESIDFGSNEPLQQSENILKVTNNGNVEVDLEIAGTELIGSRQNIPVNNIIREINTLSSPLTEDPEIVDTNILSGENLDVKFIIEIPQVISGVYTGDITIMAVKSE